MSFPLEARGGGKGGPLKFCGGSSEKKESLQILDLQRLASLWYSITNTNIRLYMKESLTGGKNNRKF